MGTRDPAPWYGRIDCTVRALTKALFVFRQRVIRTVAEQRDGMKEEDILKIEKVHLLKEWKSGVERSME